jgi:hypothetical protein
VGPCKWPGSEVRQREGFEIAQSRAEGGLWRGPKEGIWKKKPRWRDGASPWYNLGRKGFNWKWLKLYIKLIFKVILIENDCRGGGFSGN